MYKSGTTDGGTLEEHRRDALLLSLSLSLSLLSLLCLPLFLCGFFGSVFGERRSVLESEDRQGEEEEQSCGWGCPGCR